MYVFEDCTSAVSIAVYISVDDKLSSEKFNPRTEHISKVLLNIAVNLKL